MTPFDDPCCRWTSVIRASNRATDLNALRHRLDWAQAARGSSWTKLTHEQLIAYHDTVILPHPVGPLLEARLARALRRNRRSSENVVVPVIHGLTTAGKTTTLYAVLFRILDWEGAGVRSIIYDDGSRSIRWPVVITAPENGGARALMRRLCDFMGLQYSSGDSANDLKSYVLAEIERCQVQVVVIEDLHALPPGPDGANTNFIRRFIADCPATVVLLLTDPGRGVHVLTPGSKSRVHSAQILARSDTVPLERIHNNRVGAQRWAEAVNAGINGLILRTSPTKNEARQICFDTHTHAFALPGRMLHILRMAACEAWEANNGVLAPEIVKRIAEESEAAGIPGSSNDLAS